MSGKKPIIGILGGIGSGKSTVAAEFVRLGCCLIDADKIAHELLDESLVSKQVIALLGNGILNQQGHLSRSKIAEIVFKNSDKLAQLNKILHPLVLKRTNELIKKYNSENQCLAIVLDMPLLVEVGMEKRCDKLVFVDCDDKIRENRAKNKDFEKNHIKIRENFQFSLDKKKSIADNTINNNSDFSTLVRQIAKIFSNIMEDC